MATKHKIQKALTRLVQAITRFAQKLTSRNTYRFLRMAFVSYRRRVQGGFVLPTTVLLVLVVTLVIGSLLFRTFQRTEQVAIQRQQQVIYNAATPVLDRARAKLEYLFTGSEYRLGGVPGQDILAEFLQDARFNLNGETRIDINGGGVDNAWFYEDEQGNRVAYSIILQSPEDKASLEDLTEAAVAGRANSLQVRTGPMIGPAKLKAGCENVAGAADSSAVEAGWFEAQQSTAFLYKNFQINVVVINNEGGRRNITTLELEQDREAERGNKWGAWFNSDLEIHPGDTFRWNGAMHSQGNIIAANNFTAYLISSPNSCLYDETASDISVADNSSDPKNRSYPFKGQFLAGLTATNAATGNSIFNLYDPTNPSATTEQLTPSSDSVESGLPSNIAIKPDRLFTEGIHTRVEGGVTGDPDPVFTSANWEDNSPLKEGRLKHKKEASPSIDDSYRADDRLGPQPPEVGEVGTPIVGQLDLTKTKKEALDDGDTRFQTLGLDGYWERRADAEGLRLIVGERLELGNPFGWQKPTDPDPDPLFPAASCWGTRCHESLQYKTLRDNLAAVQGMVVYHAADGSAVAQDQEPLACMAMTAHPGTKITIENSTDFSNPIDSTAPNINFFTGRGTNGWEFTPPPAEPLNNTPLEKALKNLAYFAGDPKGAFPAIQDGQIHPYPNMTMWGNFSNLRRAIENGNGSLADRSYIDSAACTVGMLASNIKQLDAAPAAADLTSLETRLSDIKANPADNNGKGVVQLETVNATTKQIKIWFSGNTNTASPNITLPVPASTITAPAEAYLQVLDAAAEASGATPDQKKLAQLAWRLHLKEQVKRDRSNGTGYTCSFPATATPTYANLAPLCATQTKFPALHYIFPTVNHGEPPNAAADTIGNRDAYITGTVNSGQTYSQVTDADITAIADLIKPRALTAWKVPRTKFNTSLSTVNEIKAPGGASEPVPFLDKGMYDGRQAMGVRVLDIDLNLLKTGNGLTNNLWLPNSGIVYAFREDAVREDGIARPAGSTPLETSMKANPANPQTDPAVAANGISPKPVDYHADPARRPHGFRLKNGRDLSRPAPANAPARGLSFISDNPVYIQGDFNLHSTNGTTNDLEEFENTLDRPGWGDFYTRDRPFKAEFAKSGDKQDRWRPSEIFADAITLLSSNFCDGSIEDGLRYYPTNHGNPTGVPALYGCAGTPEYTSYMGMNRLKVQTDLPFVLRENGVRAQPTTPLAPGRYPIKINRNGSPLIFANATSTPELGAGQYQTFTDQDCSRFDNRKCIGTPVDNQYNAILIQGIVPSRQNQPYGGLHNFPRTLELWQNRTLSISGSFLQFNFSTYATGPFDQDTWEPATSSPPNTSIRYYYPPLRNWGYDVGLQLAPVPPISERLTAMGSNRSEFYYEPDIKDPYIKNLRCASADGGLVDPSAECN
ncbi:hormogonium polysaccharide biosynthesis protein HpsA [Laspinema palackyanum]|uniref:hormogonium polysaccharide biosynthesis protein HpsA n=1 Tax=Laspinema palackyanum TaxID=3231601 RepID=UPI00345D5A28|nr:hormogonium polysaccharide biosynthesis protein HpsA [Laspinema sp. D2c]